MDYSDDSNQEPIQYYDTRFQPFRWNDIRLPKFIKPSHYFISMNPDIKALTNEGNVSIYFEVKKPTEFLVIHSKNLEIEFVKLFDHIAQRAIKVNGFQECIQLEQLYIDLGETIYPKKCYRLVIKFQQIIRNKLEGLYVSTYYNVNKRKQVQLLTTHFEPTFARTAFPCFDEPALKASFKLRIYHDRDHKVYFNTIKESQGTHYVKGLKKHVTVFNKTLPMSTYLVAIVICDFSICKSYEGNTSIVTMVPVGQEDQVTYAFEMSKEILPCLEKFFKIPYPLSTLQLIVVPDFSAGAMENWGLVMFRTTTLLYDELNSMFENREHVGTVVAHELAHQWFGNLVTMHWWDDIWLNEGLASYVENIAINFLFAKWRMIDQFVVATLQPALEMDSLINSHPVHIRVTNPHEIESIFDMISYKKGSCLIQMIVSFIHFDNLQNGLKKYLKRYNYKTATTDQLWECFSEVSVSLPKSVPDIMRAWTFYQGYPLITIEWNENRDKLMVNQQMFISSLGPEEYKKIQRKLSICQQIWTVPLTMISSKDSKPTIYWLHDKKMQISIENAQSLEWIKFNANQVGFYRVNYQNEIWRELIAVLKNGTYEEHRLSSTDRAGLIDDVMTLMRIGYVDVDIAMSLLSYIEYNEFDYIPWDTVMSQILVLECTMPQTPIFHRFVLRLIEKVLNRIGWEEKPSDELLDKKLRTIILRTAIFYEHKQTVKIAKQMFQQFMEDSIAVPTHLREIVYSVGIKYGSEREWNFFWNLYLKTNSDTEKRMILNALSWTRNYQFINNYLGLMLKRNIIRSQDCFFIVQNMVRNPFSRELAWKFIRMNWNTIKERMDAFSLDSAISEVTWYFTNEFEYNEAKTFFSSDESISTKLSVKQSLERIVANIYWKKNVESKFLEWLNKWEEERNLNEPIINQSDTDSDSN